MKLIKRMKPGERILIEGRIREWNQDYCQPDGFEIAGAPSLVATLKVTQSGPHAICEDGFFADFYRCENENCGDVAMVLGEDPGEVVFCPSCGSFTEF